MVYVAVKNPDDNTRLRPAADDAFGEGDVVIVVGEPDCISRMSAMSHPSNRELVDV